ncbi:TetR/AcrR family transcriptional regulator [Salinactinospora qingdaonensis]|uniref:TetR/AcrR family transcriptional regulator n=1 Tax=Salinactinospora qingdaonensis TaxID=702744 RepID=A0ABP7FHA6_9ACTN
MDPITSRPPGRPRSQRAEDAILRAALALLAERKNVAEVSIEAIAARAEVGKATIYRRWPGKEELFADAVATLRPPLPELGQAPLRDDLIAIFTQVCAEMDSPLDRAVTVLMMDQTHPEIVHRIKQQVLAPRSRAVANLLRRGVDNGEITPDVDPEAVVNLLTGGAFFCRRPAGGRSAQERAQLLVDTVWNGIRA